MVSRKGEDTKITIYLPVSSSTEDTFPTKEWADAPHGRGETVLLVEDNPTVLEVSRMQLEYLEYQVLAAVGGEEALVVFAGHKDEIALVPADMMMPGMGGAALLKALQAKTPDIKMVVITCYPLGEESSTLLEQGIVDWVQKPLNIAQLAVVMNRALQGG